MNKSHKNNSVIDFKHDQYIPLDHALTIKLIANPLVNIPDNLDSREAHELLKENSWDAAGVYSIDSDSNTMAYAYIEHGSLTSGLVRDHIRDFTVDTLLAESTPIRTALPRISQQHYLFILGDSGVNKIVTVADLATEPVQMVLFSIVSRLEEILANTIRIHCPSEYSWTQFLNDDRLGQARIIQSHRTKLNQELDLVSCLQLPDKAEVIVNVLGGHSNLGFPSKKSWHKFVERIRELRDNLAHCHKPNGQRGWDEIADIIDQSDRLTGLLYEITKH